MATSDTCCTIVPYFKVHDGKLEDFKTGCPGCRLAFPETELLLN